MVVPVDESLVKVSDPDAAPATLGLNCTWIVMPMYRFSGDREYGSGECGTSACQGGCAHSHAEAPLGLVNENSRITAGIFGSKCDWIAL
jgi:hypothetical protein